MENPGKGKRTDKGGREGRRQEKGETDSKRGNINRAQKGYRRVIEGLLCGVLMLTDNQASYPRESWETKVGGR